jgi:orotidine-5'-phosphate decarboxylase
MPQIARRHSVSSFGERLSKTFSVYGQLCVGIDPSAKQLLSWSLPDSATGAKQFSLAVLEASAGQVGIIKPQVAFFEQYGPSGLAALAEVMIEAKQAGLLVIADAKRGDIGSSIDGYTRSWLSNEASFQVDALTLSPFLGIESLRPTIEIALRNKKGVFVLAATSNPEALQIQAASREGKTISSLVASFANSFNEPALGSVGCVVGATVKLADLGLSQDSFANTPILMPGFGAQGVELAEVGRLFGGLKPNLICSVSRSVASDSRAGLDARIAAAKSELAKGMEL